MTDIQQHIDLAAPRDRVWATLTDLDAVGEWVEEHRGFPDGAPDTLEPGTTYRQTVSAAGKDVDLEWTVVDIADERLLAFDGQGPAGAKATLRYELDDAGDGGTRLAYATSFDLPGGPIGTVVGNAAAPGEDDARRTLDRLKTIVEG